MKSKKQILLLAVLVILVLAVGIIGYLYRPQAVAGSKTVEIEIFHSDGSVKTVTLTTDADTLREACGDLISGRESEYGLFITAVDGEVVDESLQQWWCITKGGQEHYFGADDTMIANGDHYEFSLKTGW